MKSADTTQHARRLAWLAGAMDAATGAGLVAWPEWTLAAMGAAAPTGDARVFLRWLGAFVGAVGVSYLVALRRGRAALREVLVTTLLFRAAAGGFCLWAVLAGELEPRWITVAATDGALALAQLWLLNREGWKHGDL